jgi:uncharacterized protein
MSSTRWCALVWLGCWLSTAAAQVQRVDGGVNIGSTHRLWSTELTESRRIFVYLPERYAESHQHYPVMYLLDGEMHFHHATGAVQFLATNGRIPEMIVVGISNTDRKRDLTPSTGVASDLKEDPTAGGADRFLKFMVDELAPWVEAHYRTAPFRILVGHSLGGLLDIYALATRPNDFQAYIAISPSLWWDDMHYVDRAKLAFPSLESPHFLYLSWCDQEDMIARSSQKLAGWVTAHPPEGLVFAAHYYPGETHSTTPHRSLYDGLEMIYAGWKLPYDPDDEKQLPDLAAVETHFAALSKRFGYHIDPTVDALNDVGRNYIAQHEYPRAVTILEHAAALYPESDSVQETLGKALEGSARLDEALEAYQRALALVVEGESPYGEVDDYRNDIAALQRRRVAARLVRPNSPR